MANVDKEFTAEKLTEILSQANPKDIEYQRNNFLIRGKLDLKHRTIRVAVTCSVHIWNCEAAIAQELLCCIVMSSPNSSRSEEFIAPVLPFCAKNREL